jgi:hypothetical protein
MAARRPRLLCYGHDDMLLYTRKCILDEEFSVGICSGLAWLGELLVQGPVHVVVLCHSVPESEGEEVIEMSRAAWPGVKILTLQESDLGDCAAHSDKTMECLEGPPALLHEIHTLLRTAAAQSAAQNATF